MVFMGHLLNKIKVDKTATKNNPNKNDPVLHSL